ncbi:MAG: alpha/beta hydrolase [Acidobacteriota bacterium]
MKKVVLSTQKPVYTLHGTQSDLPLLIYVSGLDGSGELFYKQLPSLTRNYRIVTYRLREDARATYDDLSDDIASIIEDLGETQAIILGESFGGTIVLHFALRYPTFTQRLVLVNSFPYYRRRLRIQLAAFLASALPARFVVPFRLTSAALGLLVDRVSREDRKKIVQILRSVEMKSYARRLQLIAQVDVTNRLNEIQAPTLLIATERDLLVPSVREAREMQKRIPNATVKILRRKGHACLLRDDVKLYELIKGWLSQ